MQQRLVLLAQAAEAIAVVESVGLGLPTSPPGEYRLRDRAAQRVDCDLLDLPVEWTPPGASLAIEVAMLPTAAVEIRIGKFSTPTRLRARAFYAGIDGDVTLKIVNGPDRARLRREVTARHALRRTLADLAPRIIASGEHGGLAWIAEEVLAGVHPIDASAQHQATCQLAPVLIGLHRVERRVRPVSSVLGADTVTRLKRWLQGMPDDDPGRDIAVSAVGAGESLLRSRRDCFVHIGWCHGDAALATSSPARMVSTSSTGSRSH